MNKKVMISTGIILSSILLSISLIITREKNETLKVNKLQGTILQTDAETVTIQDSNHVIYTFDVENMNFSVGDSVLLEYTGLLDKNKNNQTCNVINYEVVSKEVDDSGIPSSWLDQGIFSGFYKFAYKKLQTLTLEEKIGQLLLVRYPDSNQVELLQKYDFGGYVFYEKDFIGNKKEEVIAMINKLQEASKIPILTAVDEEGGKVVRISSNKNLVAEEFKSPSELYASGGFDAIEQDTILKSKILSSLGMNLNLAPVVDVSTNSNDYMHERTLKEDTSLTSTYAKTVIQASKGTNVSYTLKHFPGYGSNKDTHVSSSVDTRTYDEILQKDLPPFKAGIEAGAEAVLMSHNIVNSIDSTNPASLSKSVHNLLRNELNFTGIIITDDLAMNALNGIDDTTVKAIQAGNDLIITTDYEESINSIKAAVKNGTISEDQIDKLAFRVLAWKYYKLLLLENQK